MAKSDDTSKNRSGRKASRGAVAPSTPSSAGSSAEPAPLTLEKAIENERALLLEVQAMLKCLYEVLLYAEDEDSITHAEVAHCAARLIEESVVRMDLVRLRPLIDALQHRGSGGLSDEAPEVGKHGAYQAREPRPMYLS